MKKRQFTTASHSIKTDWEYKLTVVTGRNSLPKPLPRLLPLAGSAEAVDGSDGVPLGASRRGRILLLLLLLVVVWEEFGGGEGLVGVMAGLCASGNCTEEGIRVLLVGALLVESKDDVAHLV